MHVLNPYLWGHLGNTLGKKGDDPVNSSFKHANKYPTSIGRLYLWNDSHGIYLVLWRGFCLQTSNPWTVSF